MASRRIAIARFGPRAISLSLPEYQRQSRGQHHSGYPQSTHTSRADMPFLFLRLKRKFDQSPERLQLAPAV